MPNRRRLLAILRRVSGLYALSCARRGPLEPPEPGPLAPGHEPYDEQLTRIEDTDRSLVPWRDTDIRAWRRLTASGPMNEHLGSSIVRVLMASVPDPAAQVPVRPPSPTLAIRHSLCVDDDIDRLIADLAPTLADMSNGPAALPSWQWEHREVIREMPAGFRRYFLWGLALAPWTDVLGAVNAYYALALEDDPALRRAVALMFSLGSRDTVLPWCAAIEQAPPARRVHLVELVIETGAHGQPPPAQLARLRDVPDEGYRIALYDLLGGAEAVRATAL